MRLDFAESLRWQRLKIRMTQADVASAMGWSRQTMTKIEGGDRPVHVDELPRLCEVLRCGVLDLFAPISSADRESLRLPPRPSA